MILFVRYYQKTLYSAVVLDLIKFYKHVVQFLDELVWVKLFEFKFELLCLDYKFEGAGKCRKVYIWGCSIHVAYNKENSFCLMLGAKWREFSLRLRLELRMGTKRFTQKLRIKYFK